MADGVAINHIGLSVPDIDAAIAWYGDVLVFRLVTPPAEMDTTDP